MTPQAPEQPAAPRRKPAFRLKLFDARKLVKPAGSMRFYDLNTVIYTGPNHEDGFDLIASSIGPEIGYGTLMAYLFRRFGYPNAGWDDYKELACYQLSTPAPDMYMRVTPFVGDTAGISIMFMVASDSHRAIDDYERQPRLDHLARFHLWLETTGGLPSWADECLQAVQRDYSIFGVESFQAALSYLELYRPGPSACASGGDSSARSIPVEWLDWAKEKRATFEAIDPRPGVLLRSRNIEQWPDADPMKRYALAAMTALADLKTAVRVRDSAINAFGRADDARLVLKEPAVAGYPSGAIGNAAPKEFAQLHGLIMKLGKGDAKRGIAKVLKALGEGA